MVEWSEEIEKGNAGTGRRETISWLYDQMGRGKDTWWATTVWVEYERSKGIVNKKDGLGEGYNICVTKTISATPDQVYAAWVSDAASSWLGCGGATEGGNYADESGNTGTWTRLRPGKDVRLLWQSAGISNSTNVDAAFVDKGGGKTGITLNHARIQDRPEADGLRLAWGEAFDKLKKQLEG